MDSQTGDNCKYFGTDGIRARVGDAPMTPEFVLKLGWAVGKVFAAAGDKVVIGKDTRRSGYLFESVLEAGVSAAGLDVYLSGPLPTPALSYMTSTLNAAGGIVISASHNPFHDNGIKLLGPDGSKLSLKQELEIERWLERSMEMVEPARLGKAHRIEDGDGRYIEYCKGATRRRFNLSGVRVVLDCAHGAAYKVAPCVFKELGAEVHAINIAPDGENINRDCGVLETGPLREAVAEHKADVGIAVDGDGDRVVMVDRRGEVYDGDDLLILILNRRLEKKRFGGGVVGTQMSSLGLERAVVERGLEFVRVPVGDPYVLHELSKRSWVLGGEPSGHIMCSDKMITADAIIAALEVCEAVKDAGFNLAAAREMMRKYPRKMVNVPCPNGAFDGRGERLQPLLDEAADTLGDKGRVLVRASGTEPYVRVMVEGETPEICDEWVGRLDEAVRKVVGDG